MVEAILALGSNVGDRARNLRSAVREIGREVRILEASSVYETEPMYLEKQRPFLNCVLAIETDLAPSELLSRMLAVEKKLGRKRGGPRYGPRRIDIDIAFYGDQTLSTTSLRIPHPKVRERAFVLVPLSEIRPRLVHPKSGESVLEMLAPLEKKGVVRSGEVSAGSGPSEPRRLRRPGRSRPRRVP